MELTRMLYVIENIFFGGGERSFAQIINGLDKKMEGTERRLILNWLFC